MKMVIKADSHLFLSYLLKAAIIQLVLFGFYQLVLNRFTFFQERRMYLLSSLAISLIIPLLQFSNMSVAAQSTFLLPEFIVADRNIAFEIDSLLTFANWNLSTSLLSFYLIGAIGFLVLFLNNLFRIYRLFKISNKRQYPNHTIYYHTNLFPCFSFFNNIFINKDSLDGTATKQIIEHELIHIRQNHSVDSIFIELLSVLFWWLPVVRFYQKEIKLLHEFIADQHCVRTKEEQNKYVRLIISQSFPEAYIKLTNPFSKLIFKKRIAMLSQIKTSKSNRIHFLWVLPIITILIFSFCSNKETINSTQTETSISDTSKIYTVVDEMPKFIGGDDELMKFLNENIHYPQVCKDEQIEGRVFVQFVVGITGAVSQAVALGKADERLKTEALRAVNTMPNWIPGKQNGKKVNVKYTLPINFKLPPPPLPPNN